jgi:hypothetical protein
MPMALDIRYEVLVWKISTNKWLVQVLVCPRCVMCLTQRNQSVTGNGDAFLFPSCRCMVPYLEKILRHD